MHTIAKSVWDIRICLVLIAFLTALTLTLFLWAGSGETVSANPFSSAPGLVSGQSTTVMSRGIEAHGAKTWHDAGYKGGGSSPIKVGIIDSGFEGFSRLMGSELPPATKVFARCHPVVIFHIDRATSNVADCEHNGNHGTKVAETLIDVAPEVELYISNAGRGTALLVDAAVAWMDAEGVEVINHSLGDPLKAPGDGNYGVTANQSHSLRTIDLAVDGGTVTLSGKSAPNRFNGGALWVNAIGNDATKMWYGRYINPDGDEWLSFRRDASYYLANQISLSRGEYVTFSMRWNNPWPGATCNLDLYLYHGNDQVASSRNNQNGGASTPYESMGYTVAKTGAHRLFIRSVKRTVNGSVIDECPVASRPSWIQLQVYDTSGSLAFTTDRGNGTFNASTTDYYQVGVPAESKNPGMLAVGGASLGRRTTASQRSYSTPRITSTLSSRGPTIDGRIKPEIVGTNCEDVSSAQACGTSFAAPHVAGLAALVLHRYKDAWGTKYTPADLANYLKENAVQKNAALSDPNNVWGYGFAMLPNPAPAASFSTAPTSITAGSSQSFTIDSNSNVSSVKVVINNAGDTGKLAFGGSGAACPSSSGSASSSRSKGVAFSIKGCTAGEVTLRLYKANNILLRIHTVKVTLPPPTGLSLSTVSGQNSWLRVAYTRSQSPHRYQFKLEQRNLSARTETWTVVDTNTDSSPPETFKDVVRGYHYRARGRNCQDTSQEDTCGAWSDYTNIIEFSDPGIAISGLTGSYIAGDTDAFSVTLSDLTLDQPYTVTLASSQGSVIGFNFRCNYLPSKSFTPLDNSHTVYFTLQACQIPGTTVTAQSGTVTAKLWKGSAGASGGELETATANATVTKATGGLSPRPSAITVGHDQTFTLTTNVPNSAGVWVTATVSGDTGRTTLPPTESCLYASSGHAAVNGNTITLRGCQKGKTTLTLYRSNSIIQLAAYDVTVNASDTELSPRPSTITAGHDLTFTLSTGVPNNPGVWITATVPGNAGRTTLPPTRGCLYASSGIAAVNGNTITLRGCQEGETTLTIYRSNSSVLLASYTVNVAASNTNLSPPPAAFTIGTNQTFTLTTDIANTPGVWVGLNYNSADTGRLVLPSQDCAISSAGTAAVNGSSIALKPCTAGTVTIKVNRSYSSVTLVSYPVTINSS